MRDKSMGQSFEKVTTRNLMFFYLKILTYFCSGLGGPIHLITALYSFTPTNSTLIDSKKGR